MTGEHVHAYTWRNGQNPPVHQCVWKGCSETLPKIERAWAA